MIHHVRGMAIGQYRRDIDPGCPSDELAEAALLEMARRGTQVDERRRDGKVRVRAREKPGAPWSRGYVLVDPSTGDIVGVQAESGAAVLGRKPGPESARKIYRIGVRCSRAEYQRCCALAEAAGVPLAEWARRRLGLEESGYGHEER